MYKNTPKYACLYQSQFVTRAVTKAEPFHSVVFCPHYAGVQKCSELNTLWVIPQNFGVQQQREIIRYGAIFTKCCKKTDTF